MFQTLALVKGGERNRLWSIPDLKDLSPKKGVHLPRYSKGITAHSSVAKGFGDIFLFFSPTIKFQDLH